MDDPFFHTPYPQGGFFRKATPSLSPAPSSSQPKHSGCFRQTTPSISPAPSSSHPKKVVSIPIHFVGSEKAKSDSALKIQKAFRGFRVRKNVKKILAIQREVGLVEKKLQERETVELIKKDEKERLKMNESLMALLFKLDSVRSVNDSVRDCRKAAIKKAIMLQERIDSFFAAIDDQVKDSDEIASETVDTAVDEADLKQNMDDSGVERVEILQDVNNSGVVEVETPENVNDSGVVGVEIPEKVEQAEHEAWQCVGDVTTEDKSDFVELSEGGNSTKRSCDEWFVVGGDGEESKRSKKLLEKRAEDNQKLMAMVAELCDRNAAQASLISSLSQRVEQLEKAMSDSLRKKKKKNHLNSLTHTTGS